MECTGIRGLDFADSSGKQVKGTQLYVLYTADGVNGRIADKLFINASSTVSLPKGLKPGDMLSVSFDIKGKPFNIEIANQSSQGFPSK